MNNEQNNNIISVIAQEASIGNTVEEAKKNFIDIRKKLKEENVQLKQDLEIALTNLDDAKLEIIKIFTIEIKG